ELARVAMVDPAPLLILSVLFSCGLVATILWPAVGYPAAGLALLLITGWLWYHDVARRTIGGTGLTRYMAAAMLAGYFWLIIAAAVWILDADPTHGAAYDAALHAVFLGFTMSMIFAHAPVILPAIARRPLPYHRLFWVPWLRFQGLVAVRLWCGDLYGCGMLRQTGGAVSVVAVLLFALLVVSRLARSPWLMFRLRHHARERAGHRDEVSARYAICRLFFGWWRSCSWPSCTARCPRRAGCCSICCCWELLLTQFLCGANTSLMRCSMPPAAGLLNTCAWLGWSC